MGPIEMFFSAQSLLCAVSVIGMMKLITAILTVAKGKDGNGKPSYKKSRALTVFVLPIATIVLGAVYGVFVPFRPEVLMEHFIANPSDWEILAFAAWGAACGQFAQTLYDRVADIVRPKSAPAK